MSRTVGNYILEKKLGHGSYATVYQAHHKSNGGNYAVKVISREKIGSAKLQTNLEQEIAIMKEINHENVVRLFGTFTSKNNFYLVLEFCGGGDLHNYILRHTRLDETITRRFLIQLARGLQFLHSKGIIHRDIKPQNLLLSEFSPNAVIKFADFGFAKHLQESSMAQTQCGTPLYMAPEIFDMKDYDAKADVWSIGCVLFEMCAGEPPFKGSNHRELLMNIKSKSLRLPNNVTVSREITEILQRLLELDPQRRVNLDQLHRVTERMAADMSPHVLASPSASGGEVIGSSSTPLSSSQSDPGSKEQPDVVPDRMSGSAFNAPAARATTPTAANPADIPPPPPANQSGSPSSPSMSGMGGSLAGGVLRRVRSREKVHGRQSPLSGQAQVDLGASSSSSMTPATATMLVKLANPGTSPNSDRALAEHASASGAGGGGGSSAVSKALSSGLDIAEEDRNMQRQSAREGNRYLRASHAGGHIGRLVRYADSPTPSFGRDSDDFVLIDEPTSIEMADQSGGGQVSRSMRERDERSLAMNQQAQAQANVQNNSPSAHWYGGSPGSNLGANMINIDTAAGSGGGMLTESSFQHHQQQSEGLQLSECAHRCQYIISMVAVLTKHADSVVRDILNKHGKIISREMDREAILGPDGGDRDRDSYPRARTSSASSGDGYNIFNSSNHHLTTGLQMLSDALCIPFSFYLHSMNYIQDAIQRTVALKMQQLQDAGVSNSGGRNRQSPLASSPGSHMTTPAHPSSQFLGQLDSLVAGLSQRFDQLMGRAESCQKWIRADATYPVPEPFIYQTALKLGQEAAVEELLGNLSV